MDTIYPSCAGLDVHKKTVECTVRRIEGKHLHTETRQFGTMTRDLLALADWLTQERVTHVVMESTGVFWKPIYNILDGLFTLLLVNAQHVKQVPGRKTDVRDSQWLAQLLQHGLLRGSFVPSRPIRDLRDLTRQRLQLVAEHGRVVNRIHKILEDANIKLGTVASDILGLSGRDMLDQLIAGQENPNDLAELARGRLRSKIPALQSALEGHLTDHHRFMLRLLREHLTSLEAIIQELEARIETVTRPFSDEIARLDEIPGVDRRVAEVILAEIGPDMNVFPTAKHLASWAGMCPGNHESAGKRKTGKTRKGSRWLRQMLTQAGWAASHSKRSYLGAQYKRIIRRRGKKRAQIAVGHSILIIAHHLLAQKVRYQDLGSDYFEKLDPEGLTKYLVKRLEHLGHKVVLVQDSEAA